MSVVELVYGPETPVAIFQWASEFEELLAVYRERAPKRVLEIGTYHGGTLYHWLQNAPDGAIVVSVDSYAVGVDNRHLYEDWRPESVTLHALEGDSHDPAIAISVYTLGGPFDWVFIDAGHYFDEVRRDWEMYGPMCAKGGVVVFHDILPPTKAHPEIEVSRLWQELKADYVADEIIADPGAEWGGLGIVHMP